jgi:2',3'-cyclic-nucleotide 3'-phosphodiesterase
LYYIADEDAHERARILQELERENVVGRSANPGRGGVMLKCASSEGDVVALDGFLGTQIWIMDCEGPVEGWKVIDKILLAKSDR